MSDDKFNLNQMIKQLFDSPEYKHNESFRNEIREKLDKTLNDTNVTMPSDEEMQITMQQFSSYLVLQLLQYTAIKNFGDQANKFMGALIDDFIQQRRSHANIQLEIDAVEQQNTMISELFSDELMQKERTIVQKRLDNLYTEFEKKMKTLLYVKESDLPKSGDHNESEF